MERTLKSFIKDNTKYENQVICFGSKVFTQSEFDEIKRYVFGRGQKLKNKRKDTRRHVVNFLEELVLLVKTNITRVNDRIALLRQSKNLTPMHTFINDDHPEFHGGIYLYCSTDWNRSCGMCFYN